MSVAVLAQVLCPGIQEWLQAVEIYSRGYIPTTFVYKDIPRISADTPLFLMISAKNRVLLQPDFTGQLC